MKVRFQADADLNEILVKAMLRREPGIDIQTARAAGLAGLVDNDVLALAVRSGRLLLTHDRKTMPKSVIGLLGREQRLRYAREESVRLS